MSTEIQTIDSALQQFKHGEFNIEQLQKVIQENGAELSFWNPATERHPAYAEGDNRSRAGYIFHTDHPKGKFLQNIIKKAILRAIDFAHSSVTKHYDPEGFVYDDPRLQRLSDVCKGYIADNFQHAHPYKSDFMHKVVDILLFLMKEDAYYRARFLDLLNQIPNDFELDELERENIEQWH